MRVIRALIILAVSVGLAYWLHIATFGSGFSDDSEFTMFFLLGLCSGMFAVLAYRADP